MADLVTRLRLDDKEFNNNIRKSKKQIKDFGDVCNAVGKGVSKAFIAFEAVKAVMDTFNFAINSSSETAKIFSTTIDTAKTTVSNFFSSLLSGDWTPFENGLKESISLANKFAEAMNQTGKSNEWGTYYADYLEGRRNQLEYIITSDNSTAAQKKDAQAQYAELAAEEEQVRQGIINKNLEAINAGLASKGIKEKYSINQLMQMAHRVNTTNKELTQQERAFADLISSNDFKPLFDAIINNTDKIGTIKKDWDDSITDVRDKLEEEEKELGYSQGSIGYLDDLIASKEEQLNASTNMLDRNRIRKEIDDLNKEKHYIELEPTLGSAYSGSKTSLAKSMPEMGKLNKIHLDDAPSKWAMSITDSFAMAGSSIQALGSAFSAFSENAALGKSAMILGAIGQLVYAYASVSKNVTSPWEWIAFAISGAATLATVVGQLKGYASGGIVNSPYTTGDKNLIKVNGGEMILTRGQQANLFNMLQNGTTNNLGGNVTFRIQGKELVGVLNNYNSKISKVL